MRNLFCGTVRLAACLTIFLFCNIAVASATETLRIGGTGAALGTMKHVAKAYSAAFPGTKIEVLPSLGSGGGIRALTAGSIDLSLSARPLKNEEAALGLEAKKFGTTAIVFAGNKSLLERNVSDQQLVEIYQSGEALWPDGERIRIVLRPERETDTKLMKKHIHNMADALEKARVLPGVPTAYNDQETADLLERIPGALGTSTLSLLISENRKLQVFALNGVMPSIETIRDGSYPMTKAFYLVFPKSPTEAARNFGKFLFSPKGREILSTNGHFTG